MPGKEPAREKKKATEEWVRERVRSLKSLKLQNK